MTLRRFFAPDAADGRTAMIPIVEGRSRGCLATGSGAAVLAVFAPLVVTVRAGGSGGVGLRSAAMIEYRAAHQLRRVPIYAASISASMCHRQSSRGSVAASRMRWCGWQRRFGHRMTCITWSTACRGMKNRWRFRSARWSRSSANALRWSSPRVRWRGRLRSGWRSVEHHALSDVVDPDTYDPEADGEPERPVDASGSAVVDGHRMGPVGPSLIFRLVMVVPSEAERRVLPLLESLT